MSIIPNALPYSVTSYAITSSSPTGELLTLGRIYDEVGDYASTILDNAHRALTRLCRRRSAAVTRELRRRGILTEEATSRPPIASPAVPTADLAAPAVPADSSPVPCRGAVPFNDEVVVPPPSSLITDPASLSSMSISDLYTHYLAWPQRHEALIESSHEPLDFSYEARIIRELQRRTAATLDEQLKIDYCLLTYRNELLNLSPILSLPLEAMPGAECIIHN